MFAKLFFIFEAFNVICAMRSWNCSSEYTVIPKKKKKTVDNLTFFDISDMWTNFEILNRTSCRKLNLLSIDKRGSEGEYVSTVRCM